jgi:hypothetical protein
MTDRLRMDQPSAYRIVVQGHLSTNYLDWLEGMTFTHAYDDRLQPITILTGELLDQAALIGVLRSLFNRQHPVLYVKYQPYSSHTEQLNAQGDHSHEDA